MSEGHAPVVHDPSRLLAEFRRGDVASKARAYRRVFGTALGNAVLLDILHGAGVGESRGLMDADQRPYHDGRHDMALAIAAAAGFDRASVAMSVLTDTLEGRQTHGHPDDGTYTGPDSDPDALTDPDAEP